MICNSMSMPGKSPWPRRYTEEPHEFTIQTGSCMKAVHGEDALFADELVHIVVDGVGGTKISSAPFAVALVEEIREAVHSAVQASHSAKRRLSSRKFYQCVRSGVRAAKEKFSSQSSVSTKKGSSSATPFNMAATFNAVFLDKYRHRLICVVVGDTKTIVVRHGKVVFESTSLTHEFNVPANVTSSMRHGFEDSALLSKFSLLQDDIVITCTDGVTDNLCQSDLTGLLEKIKANPPDHIAKKIVELSHLRSESPINECSPFAISASMEYKRRVVSELQDSSKVRQTIKDLDRKRIRSIFGKESVLSLPTKHYSLSVLLAFANMTKGKIDDTSVAVSLVS